MNQEYIFQVSEFNEAVNRHLSRLGTVQVEGEISQINISKGKWVFLTICDDNACVSVFSIAYKIPHLSVLNEGTLVHVWGKPALYQKSGRFSLQADRILPAGEGALALAKAKLKQKLSLEGIFDDSHKRKIPRFINRIGLITAKGSRAYSDFIKILQARMGGIKVYYYPIQVQGNDSIKSILKAFQYFNNCELDLDCLVMTRGGGSAEDLASFDSEAVVRAVFSSKYPVVTAIGHEADVSLCDLAADLRASTPSNAAELITPTREKVRLEIQSGLKLIEHNLRKKLITKQEVIDKSISVLSLYFTNFKNLIKTSKDKLRTHLMFYLNQLNIAKENLIGSEHSLSTIMSQKVDQSKSDINYITRLLSSFDHHQVLKRGFSITRSETGNIISSITHLKTNQKIDTQIYDGEFSSLVTIIRKD